MACCRMSRFVRMPGFPDSQGELSVAWGIGGPGQGVPCKARDRVDVSTVSGLVAETAVGLDAKNAGVSAFHDAVFVEDIASPDALTRRSCPSRTDWTRTSRASCGSLSGASRRVAKELSGLSSGSGTASSPVRRSWDAPPRSPAPFREHPQRLRAFRRTVPHAHALRSAGGGPRLRTRRPGRPDSSDMGH